MRSETQAPAGERRLHGDYWATAEDGVTQLTAKQCTGCGACYLPAIATCVTCRGKAFHDKPLSSTGLLYTYTIVRGSGGVWPDVYTIGYVDYPEQVRVCGHLRETDPDKLSVGMRVATEEAVLYTDAGGNAVKCFRFHSAEVAQ